MINFHDEIIKLKANAMITGNRPLYIDVKEGEHPYKGKYLMTINGDKLQFYELKKNYKFNEKSPNYFYINLEALDGYHYAYYKEFAKRITLYFKDGIKFEFIFELGYSEAYGNEDNANYLMKYLKENNILQKNEIRSDNVGAKKIKKVDQWFVQEVRGTTPKRRGLFKR